MQQLKSISPQWEAKGGKLRPVNTWTTPTEEERSSDDPLVLYVCRKYDDFEETAKRHTFDTNAPDRIYKVEELEEPVWQYCAKDGIWYTDITITERNHSVKAGLETRQFVPLKEQH